MRCCCCCCCGCPRRQAPLALASCRASTCLRSRTEHRTGVQQAAAQACPHCKTVAGAHVRPRAPSQVLKRGPQPRDSAHCINSRAGLMSFFTNGTNGTKGEPSIRCGLVCRGAGGGSGMQAGRVAAGWLQRGSRRRGRCKLPSPHLRRRPCPCPRARRRPQRQWPGRRPALLRAPAPAGGAHEGRRRCVGDDRRGRALWQPDGKDGRGRCGCGARVTLRWWWWWGVPA